MKKALIAFCLPLLLLASCKAAGGLPLSTPEAQGVSPRAVLDFVEALETEVDAPHGFVLLRHGHAIARGWWSPFTPHDNHKLYSLSKSFTSTAVGMAADEGLLSVDDKVLSFFPDDAPENQGENLKAMRVRDLLTMTTGHAKDTLGPLTGGKEGNWPRVFLALPVEHEPGTHFLYNTGATYMCSAIVQKVTGKTVLGYLTPRLFEPLGIENPQWESDPRGVNVGGWGLKITTTDIAKFGQLYLQKGEWRGERLLSEAWIEAATSTQTPNGTNPQNDWNQGYGYQFWRSRHNAYRADGAFGQFCIVMPEQDAVLAITGGQIDMQRTLDLVWKHLLPGMADATPPKDAESRKALAEKLAKLSHAPVAGEAASPTAAKVSGKRYVMRANAMGLEAVTFDFTASPATLALETSSGPQRFELGSGAWEKQVVPFTKLGMAAVATTGPEAVAASGAWGSDDLYIARAWLHETPYRLDMEFNFDAEVGTLTVKQKLHPVQAQWTEAKGMAR